MPRRLKSCNPVPARWRKELQRVLITDAQIARRVEVLSKQIQRDFKGRELVIVAVLNGTIMFLADLIRCLSLPLRLLRALNGFLLRHDIPSFNSRTA